MPAAGCGGAEEREKLNQESALARVSAARVTPTLEPAGEQVPDLSGWQ
jgi:hypothetical protein